MASLPMPKRLRAGRSHKEYKNIGPALKPKEMPSLTKINLRLSALSAGK